ncbi:hypothetical protein ACC691_41120, partial [Rhizobium johnstonii]|uniref:hypothetical protein n=1 Tax=Rhizobium johnstonii TaxID=3019933 RepID=UPI003F945EF5
MELLDPRAVALISEHLGAEALSGTPLEGLDAEASAFLLVQCDGLAAAVEATEAVAVIERAGGRAVRA